jgi:thiamine-phosphate pyrophosphorylase
MQSYLITDPSLYTHDLPTFKARLQAAFTRHQPDYALYRDKAFKEYESFATLFVAVCQEYGIKAMLHNQAALAFKLQAHGVHYSGDKLCSIGTTSNKLFQVLSTHSLEEIKSAATLGIDAVTYSPIFATPNKGQPVGIEKLKEVVSASPLPVIALGGIINEKQIQEIKKTQTWAFASIRYFQA